MDFESKHPVVVLPFFVLNLKTPDARDGGGV